MSSALGFIGGTLDRAALKRTDKGWLKDRLERPDSQFVRFFADRPAIRVDDEGPASIAFAGKSAANGSEPVFIGIDDTDRAVFAVQSSEDDAPADETGCELMDLRSLAVQGLLPPQDMGLLAQARTLLHWHSRHQFCANCGARTEIADGGYRRSCPACEASHFPRTDPVAIMVVTKADQCLLGRGHHFAEGMYSALAGFVEPGESLEEAARREILEESGIHVGKVTYHSSQPWPFPANLMIGVLGEATSETLEIDPEELEDCRWFGLDEVRSMLSGDHPDGLKTPPPMAIAHHLIKAVAEV